MEIYSNHISKLIQSLSSLPGVGAKTAQRLAFHIISMPEDKVERLAKTLLDTRRNIRYCSECWTLYFQMVRGLRNPVNLRREHF